MNLTHEQYIQAVRSIVIENQEDADVRERLARCKLAYGYGKEGLRGVTIYSRWANGHGPNDPDPFVEICAAGESSVVQLAGTTIHELGHVVAGWEAGHSHAWKSTCAGLGLRRIQAAGTDYLWSMFAPTIRESIDRLGVPGDGSPLNGSGMLKIGRRKTKIGPCSAGVGTRGGKSRGKGSGSRMRKFVCDHGQIIRAATNDLDVTCNVCDSLFVQPV